MIPRYEPVSTKTDYVGVASEGQVFYRHDVGSYKLDQVGGLGLDFWRRRISQYRRAEIEDYSVLFMRAGMRLAKVGGVAGLHGECGIKYPISIRETHIWIALGFTSNPAITPKGAVSGYAEIGYRINSRFDVLGYYDSCAFRRSADVRANKPTDTAGMYWLIYQPESSMDALGIKLLVSF